MGDSDRNCRIEKISIIGSTLHMGGHMTSHMTT